MKKLIIVIIIVLILVYLGLKSETAQNFIDNLRESHQVEIIR